MMTCRELTAFILDYQDGTLPDAARKAFEHHLSLCPNCVRYLQEYNHTVALERAAFAGPAAPVPADVPEELVQAILSVQRARLGQG